MQDPRPRLEAYILIATPPERGYPPRALSEAPSVTVRCAVREAHLDLEQLCSKSETAHPASQRLSAPLGPRALLLARGSSPPIAFFEPRPLYAEAAYTHYSSVRRLPSLFLSPSCFSSKSGLHGLELAVESLTLSLRAWRDYLDISQPKVIAAGSLPADSKSNAFC